MNKFGYFLMGAALLLAACNDKGSEPQEQRGEPQKIKFTQTDIKLLNSTGDFSDALLARTCEAAGENANVAISPVSMAADMAMVANLAGGKSYDEIAAALGLAGYDLSQINETYRTLLTGLPAVDPDTKLVIGSSMWFDPKVSNVAQEASPRLQSHYNAHVVALKEGDDVQAMQDSWVNEVTDGLIVKAPKIKKGTMITLINAIAFEGQWTNRFDAAQTCDGAFTNAAGERVNTPMMHNSDLYAHAYDNDGTTIVLLPYGRNSTFLMHIIMPAAGTDIRQYASQFSMSALIDDIKAAQQSNASHAHIDLTMPKFRIEMTTDFNDVLKKCGIDNAFNNLLNVVSPDLYLQQVQQSVMIDVDESGTKAAAVTSAEIACTSIGPVSGRVEINRPFLFVITESDSGIALFSGIVSDPSR